jgi:hypothetical protein
VVRVALCVCPGVFYFTFTFAILTETRSLIIRTSIRTTIRERVNIGFILASGISPDYRLILKYVKVKCQTEIHAAFVMSC